MTKVVKSKFIKVSSRLSRKVSIRPSIKVSSRPSRKVSSRPSRTKWKVFPRQFMGNTNLKYVSIEIKQSKSMKNSVKKGDLWYIP